jgi:diguanylate cyclase
VFFDSHFNVLSVEKQWEYIIAQTPASIRAGLRDIVREHGRSCVQSFYAALIEHPNAALFLEKDMIEKRLSGSLQAWLERLFPAQENDMPELIALQKQVGEIHARLEISPGLVSYAFFFIKASLNTFITEKFETEKSQIEAILYCQYMIDFAMKYMNMAHNSDFRKKIEQDQSFRMLSLGQDLNFEKETQKTTFFDWSTQALFCLCEQRPENLQTIGESQFGLWMSHKGHGLFKGMEDYTLLQSMIEKIDLRINDIRKQQEIPPGFALVLKNNIYDLTLLTNRLFQGVEALQSGLDPLTKALTRRFLDVVLQNEITFSLTNDKEFSLILIDIDHFKQINDEHGHLIGDETLRFIAEMLMNTIRSNDFVFRYGGEEFLIILTERGQDEAVACAERIRTAVKQSVITTSTGGKLRLTVSGGVTTFKGETKINTLITQADRALYEAKIAGRNRIVTFQ